MTSSDDLMSVLLRMLTGPMPDGCTGGFSRVTVCVVSSD